MKNRVGQHNHRCCEGSQPLNTLHTCSRNVEGCSAPHLSGGTKGSWLSQGVTGGLRRVQRQQCPSELLILSIMEPSRGQQNCYSQTL